MRRLRASLVCPYLQRTLKAEGMGFEPTTHFWALDFELPAQTTFPQKMRCADNVLFSFDVNACQFSQMSRGDIVHKRSEIANQLSILPNEMIEIINR